MNRRQLLQGIGAAAAVAGLARTADAANQQSEVARNVGEISPAAALDSMTLPPLPYALDALQPHISRETMEFHYGKHHRAYYDNMARLLGAAASSGAGLTEIVKKADSHSALFNNAAQAWNHTFFWYSMSPKGGGQPGGELKVAIERKFGSLEAFGEAFKKAALGNFGSGWTWLVKRVDGTVDIVNTSNAGTPITTADKPLLTIDVWEHAYYIDYRNARAKFVDVYLNSLVNWSFAEGNFKS